MENRTKFWSLELLLFLGLGVSFLIKTTHFISLTIMVQNNFGVTK